MKTNYIFLFLVLTVALSFAQERSPIIDMHMHAFPSTWPADSTPINYITGKPSLATTGNDLLIQTLVQMKKYNIQLSFVSGPLSNVKEWVISDPDRFIGAPQLPMAHIPNADIDWYLPKLNDIKDAIQEGYIGALGEITSQYAGMVPGDSTLIPYFELAEKFDLPVGFHTGRGTIRILNEKNQKRFRVDYGNPKWINEILARHPNLRVYLMHAGYPYFEDTIALMGVYSNVYVDISSLNWRITLPIFHNYLKLFINAGFENRIMFGSDGVAFPEAIGLAVNAIESAEFLTEQQKANIFYNNAARFLGLSEEEIENHHKKSQK